MQFRSQKFGGSPKPCFICALRTSATSRSRREYQSRRLLIAILCVAGLWGEHCAVAQHSTVPAKSKSPAFREILRLENIRTFRAVEKYARVNPGAADAVDARRWLIESGIRLSLEKETLAVAEAILNQPASQQQDTKTIQQARHIRAIALAQKNDVDAALGEFENALQVVRLREPESVVVFAHALSTEFQIQKRADLARKVYDQLSTAYFLNASVRRLCAGRVARLQVVGKPAPDVAIRNLSGDSVDLGKHAGHVVLVDFWATNCPPCLAAFPELTEIYNRQHAAGFEIIGVSLDDSAAEVRAFQKQTSLPWPLALDDKKVTRAWGVATIPAMFLIGPAGSVVACDLQIHRLEDAIAAFKKQ